jgi:hypothetical protein
MPLWDDQFKAVILAAHEQVLEIPYEFNAKLHALDMERLAPAGASGEGIPAPARRHPVDGEETRKQDRPTFSSGK